jgi:hypothetical protein
MLIQGQVGQPTISSIAAGATPAIRQGQLGDVIVSELHGRYYETAYRRNMYIATMTAGNISTAGLLASATSANSLFIVNPTTSGVNLAINKVAISTSIAATANAVIGIQTAISTTPITTFSTSTGGAAAQRSAVAGVTSGQAVAYSQLTTATGETGSIAGVIGNILSTALNQGVFYDFEGSIIVPPGGLIALYSSAAQTSSQVYASIGYEEIPV